MKEELQLNRNASSQLYSEAQHLKHSCDNQCQELTDSTMQSIEDLNKDLEKILLKSKNELSTMKQHLQSLAHEKQKLQQDSALLQRRVKQCEEEVGTHIVLPDSDDETQ